MKSLKNRRLLLLNFILVNSLVGVRLGYDTHFGPVCTKEKTSRPFKSLGLYWYTITGSNRGYLDSE